MLCIYAVIALPTTHETVRPDPSNNSDEFRDHAVRRLRYERSTCEPPARLPRAVAKTALHGLFFAHVDHSAKTIG